MDRKFHRHSNRDFFFKMYFNCFFFFTYLSYGKSKVYQKLPKSQPKLNIFFLDGSHTAALTGIFRWGAGYKVFHVPDKQKTSSQTLECGVTCKARLKQEFAVHKKLFEFLFVKLKTQVDLFVDLNNWCLKISSYDKHLSKKPLKYHIKNAKG